MLSLADLTKKIKAFATNPTVSDEEFLNAFIMPLVSAGGIKNRNHEEYHLNKARTSEIMNQRTDVPKALREAVSRVGIKEKALEEMSFFVDDYLDPNGVAQLSEELKPISKSSVPPKADEALIFKIQLTEALFAAISESNLPKPEIMLLWKHGVNTIDVQTGDLFRFGFDNRRRIKNIVVIPVNTAYDTHVTRKLEGESYPLVSENTLHGQWLIRLRESGEQLEQVDVRIAESLKKTGFLPQKEAKSGSGKNTCYPIGSVAIVETNNAVYFMLAASEFDEYNNAQSNATRIETSLRSLLDVYDRFGQGYDLYLPLMGTGLSRAGLSTQEAYDLITTCFINHGNMIHGHIHLVLRPEDRNDITL